MTADLTRDEIERLDRDLLDRISRGIYGDAPAPIDVRMWLRVVKHLLSEPTRLAAARAEGYREGVEAVAAALRREIPTGDGSTRSLTWSEALDAVDAIRALTPAPAEASAPVAEEFDDADMAAVGRSLLEAIHDNRDDARLKHWMPADGPAEIVSDMLNWLSDCDARIAALEAKNAALKAENAKLREIVAAVVKASEGITLGRGEADHEDWTLYLKIGDLRRARALLQGGSDAG